MKTQMRKAVVLWLLGLGAGCARPASIEVAPLPPLVSRVPVQITGVVVKDDKGNTMDPLPSLEVTAFPPDAVFLDGLKLTAKKNGPVQITVKVKDTQISTSQNTGITLIDRVDINCVGTRDCIIGTGKTLTLQVVALSDGAVVGGVVPKVDVTDVSVLKRKGPLEFTAGVPGKVPVTAKAGDVAASRDITVVDLPSEVRLRCPAGSEAHDTKVDKPRCTITQGRSIQLERDVLMDGKPFKNATTLEWSSRDARVASVDQGGLVEARDMGLTTVSLRVNGVEGSLEVGVVGDPEVSVRLGAMCSGSTTQTVTLPVLQGRRARNVVFRCETKGGVACLRRTLVAPFSPEDMASAQEACCCRL